MNQEKQRLLAGIPKIDILLQDDRMAQATEQWGRASVVDALRFVTEAFRQDILAGRQDSAPEAAEIIPAALRRLERSSTPSLRPVINGTGVVLHTNLGRAPLSPRAQRAVMDIARGYSNLEYNLETGERGSRHDHITGILRELTDAEDALVVNNNAAAVLLTLTALARGKEILVSRGELVEIGGAFRIPEVCEQSGAILREVGTTNRTRISDYEAAVCEETGAILKVHTSNYRIVGFTEETTLSSLATLAQEMRIPLIYDMGSGLFDSLKKYGLDEPDVRCALQSGADILTFSGDKLLGGAQAGLIAGKKKYVEPLRHHPLMRVLRVDKMTLAAMEATLAAYRDREEARREIPALRMITAEEGELQDRAQRLCGRLEEAALPGLRISVRPCEDKAGGGAAPLTVLPGYAVVVEMPETTVGSEIMAGSEMPGDGEPVSSVPASETQVPGAAAQKRRRGSKAAARLRTPEQLEAALRTARFPLVARVRQNCLWISVRTLMDGDDERICVDFQDILQDGN